MDGLSLLCNLHADGPLALRRLRDAGVHDLGALEGVPESTLVECLRSSAAHARRFVQEARQLALRLAESPLQPDPAGEEGGFFPHSVVPRSEREASLAWRAAPWVKAIHDAGAHPLEPGVLASLDERTCERLGAQGVRTLEALHERTSLALARSAGIPYAKLLDLAGQARHALAPRDPRDPRAQVLVPELQRRSPNLAGRSVARKGVAFSTLGPGRMHASDPGAPGPFG
jgi:hypothetical protein